MGREFKYPIVGEYKCGCGGKIVVKDNLSIPEDITCTDCYDFKCKKCGKYESVVYNRYRWENSLSVSECWRKVRHKFRKKPEA